MAACVLDLASSLRRQSEKAFESKNLEANEGVKFTASLKGVPAYKLRFADRSAMLSDHIKHKSLDAGTYRKPTGW